MTQQPSPVAYLITADQKQVADRITQLPTEHQVMQAARLMVVSTLKSAIDASANSDEWNDEDHDALCAVEVALNIVQGMQLDESVCAQKSYELEWWRVTSIVRLATSSFLRKDTVAWRHLSSAVGELEVLHNLAEFISIKTVQRSGAA